MNCPTCGREGYVDTSLDAYAIGEKVIYIGVPGRRLTAEVLGHSKSGSRIKIKYDAPWYGNRTYTTMVTRKMLAR